MRTPARLDALVGRRDDEVDAKVPHVDGDRAEAAHGVDDEAPGPPSAQSRPAVDGIDEPVVVSQWTTATCVMRESVASARLDLRGIDSLALGRVMHFGIDAEHRAM